MPLDVTELTQRLVRIPSVNPMGRVVSDTEDIHGEHRMTEDLESLLNELGIPNERQSVFPASDQLPPRDNLLARIEGRGAAANTICLLEVHQDTVPITGMTIPPFGGELNDGRVWGRGACDVKGGMSAVLAAAEQLRRDPAASQPTVILAFTINEENGFDGVRQLCQAWQGESSLLTRRPDYAIVTEPTELNVVVAHKGTVRWRCRTTGRAAHSSAPAEGINAIYGMASVLRKLESYADQLPTSAEFPRHPLLPGPTLSVGMIHGGVSVNTVPDQCEIELDRRLVPHESPSDAVAHVASYLTDAGVTHAVHESPYLAAPALPSDHNETLANHLAAVIREQTEAEGRLVGVPFGTDAGVLAECSIPTVVFGPGSIEQAHTKDEWIATASLEDASRVLLAFCRSAFTTSGR